MNAARDWGNCSSYHLRKERKEVMREAKRQPKKGNDEVQWGVTWNVLHELFRKSVLELG